MASDEGFTDKGSGVQFAERLRSYNNGAVCAFLGAGVRTKYMVAKVYSVGMYADVAALRRAVDGGAGKVDALCQPNVTKVIRIVMLRGVDSKQFADAFEEALKPRVIALGGDAALVDQFR